MTIIIADTFTQADGTLDGRLPDTPDGSSTWSTTTGFQNGGMLVESNRAVADGYYAPVTPSDTANANYPIVAAIPADGLSIPFVFHTGPDVAGDGTRTGLILYAALNGTNFYAYIRGTYTGSTMAWELQSSAGSAQSVTLADDTDYSGTYTIADGTQTLVLNSVTASSSDTYADTSGLTNFSFTMGGVHGLDSLSVENLSAASIGDVTLPMVVLNAVGSKLEGVAALSIMPRLKAYGGANGKSLLPSMQLNATGQDRTGQNALTYTLSMPTLSARGGANGAAAMSAAVVSITGTFWGLGRADLSMPKGFVSAAGRVSSGGSADLDMPLFSLVGYAGAVCSITLDSGMSVAATGTSGAVGQATLTLPLFELTASGSRQNSGSASLIMPTLRMGATAQAWLIAPSMQLTAVGTAVVAVTYEAYAVNLLKSADRMPSEKTPANEVTRYTNYPFDRIVRYKNSYFGMNATGLYLLEGTTDNGAPISYAMRTHVTDFNEAAMKTVVSTYFGGSLGAAETITLYGGKTGTNAYSYTTPRGTNPQNYRQKFGRGIKDRYYALAVAGTDAFELSSIEFELNTLARRI